MKRFGVLIFVLIFVLAFASARDILEMDENGTFVVLEQDLFRSYYTNLNQLRIYFLEGRYGVLERVDFMIEAVEDSNNLKDHQKEQLLEDLNKFKEEINNFRSQVQSRALSLHNRSSSDSNDSENSESFRLREEYKEKIENLKKEIQENRYGILNDSNLLIDEIEAIEDLSDVEKEELLKEINDVKSRLNNIINEHKNSALKMNLKYGANIKSFMKGVVEEDRTSYKGEEGKNFNVKVMPSVASERAVRALELNICDESNDCIIDFKEVGEGKERKLVYSVSAKKAGRFLGIFKTNMDVETQVESESGNVIFTKKPWWSFLVKPEN